MPTYAVRINGRTHQVEGEPDDSLLSVLRYELDLTGSKYGCGEGAVRRLHGARRQSGCALVRDASRRRRRQVRHHHRRLASGDRLHPVQQAFLDAEAFQCGYCTSGMVMATVSLLRTNPAPSEADIARVMDRNVCRCGTYPRIVRGREAGCRTSAPRARAVRRARSAKAEVRR